MGIILQKAKDFGVTTYWVWDIIDRKSQIGFLVYLGGTLVSWVSRKPTTLACSSTVTTTTQEIKAVWVLLLELSVNVPIPLKIFSDNLGATFITQNSIIDLKLKHVVLDLHFVRERTENGTLKVIHVLGTKQWANILTKALPKRIFSRLQGKLVISMTLSQVWGSMLVLLSWVSIFVFLFPFPFFIVHYLSGCWVFWFARCYLMM